MSSELLNITLLALLGSVVALVGGVVFLYVPFLSKILQKYSFSYAAGVLITVSLAGLIPEAVHELGFNAYIVASISFLIIFIFEKIFFGLHHHDESESHHHVKSSSLAFVIIGDTIHNFIDGLAIASSYLASPGLGLITSLSTFLHEVPHEVGDFGIMLKSNWKKNKILVVNIVSSLVTLLGAYFVYFYNDSEILNGILMAISAGIFFYLGVIDFLPRIEGKGNEHKLKKFIPLILGSISILLISLLVPHE
jgi:zinc and cadmium transporter